MTNHHTVPERIAEEIVIARAVAKFETAHGDVPSWARTGCRDVARLVLDEYKAHLKTLPSDKPRENP